MNIPVLANGDIRTLADISSVVSITGVDGMCLFSIFVTYCRF